MFNVTAKPHVATGCGIAMKLGFRADGSSKSLPSVFEDA
jgi:hypothetical protein